jgi:hypothetical protein
MPRCSRKKNILENSVFVAPSEIDLKLNTQGQYDGLHRITYDRSNVFVCSEPIRLEERSAMGLATHIRGQIEARGQRMDAQLEHVLASLRQARASRRPPPAEGAAGEADILAPPTESVADFRSEAGEMRRNQRLAEFQTRSDSEADAVFAALGMETWAAGAQLISVILEE